MHPGIRHSADGLEARVVQKRSGGRIKAPGCRKGGWAAAAASERVRGEFESGVSGGLTFDKLQSLAQPREIRQPDLAYIVL